MPDIDASKAVVTTDPPSPAQQNASTVIQRASTALTANTTYLAIATPTNAQIAAQVQTLTKECNGLIRLLLGQLDSTTGT